MLLIVVLFFVCADTVKRTKEIPMVDLRAADEFEYVSDSSKILEIKEKQTVSSVETKVLVQKEPKENKIVPAIQVSRKNNIRPSGEIVVYNPNSGKFHTQNCEWAKKCKRCIKIPKKDAIKKGGKPCKVCGY